MLDLSKLVWPVYPFPEYNQLQEDEIGKYTLNSLDHKLYVDPTSFPQESLAKRRLALSGMGHKLLRLQRPLFSFVDLINSPHRRFIDSHGKILKYKKTRAAPLTYHKISSFTETTQGGYILNVAGFHCKFFINRAPQLHERYAGILRVGRGFVLYALVSEKLKDTFRKI